MAETAGPIRLAPTLASPSFTTNDSDAVDSDITTAQKQELTLSTEAGRERSSPSPQVGEVEITPTEATGPEFEELSALATVAADIGSHSATSTSTIFPIDTVRAESRMVQFSSPLEIGSPSLIIGRSDEVASESISSETQKHVVSTDARQDFNSLYSELDGANAIASTMATPQIQELSGSIEIITATDLPSSVTNTSITVPELINTSSVQAPELPFGPVSAEGTPDIESPSLVIEDLTTSNISEPIELNGSEVQDQLVSGEPTTDTSKNLELGELSSTEPPKLDCFADSEAAEVTPNTSLSSHSTSSTCSGDDTLESCLTNLLKPNRSSGASSESVTSRLKVNNAEPMSEAAQASSKETLEIASTTAKTPGSVPFSLASIEATVVREKIEIVRSEIQEHPTASEATQSIENPHNFVGDINHGLGDFDKNTAREIEPMPLSRGTLEVPPSSSPLIAPILTCNASEASISNIHEHPISGPSSILSISPSWVSDANGFSEVLEARLAENTSLPLSAGSNDGTNNDGTPIVGYGSAAVRSSVNTTIDSPEEDVKMDMKSSMSDMYSHLNSGWNFSGIDRTQTGLTSSFRPDGFDDSLEPSFDMYAVSRLDKEVKIDVPDLDLPAAASQKKVRSIAENLIKPERLESSSIIAEDWPVAATFNSPSLSIDASKEEFDIDNKNMSDMDALLASVETGLETQPPLDYEMPNQWKDEPTLKSSPEIKMEPISLENISHIDSLPLATADHKTIARVKEEFSSRTREGAPSPEATLGLAALAEAQPSTLKAETREMNSTDMQLLPFSISKDTYSSRKSPEDTAKISSKRVRVEAENIEEDQKWPAKKLRQQFVEAPKPKSKKVLTSQTIELHVGPKNKCILVEKHILSKSPFFALLFNQHPSHQKFSQAYHFPRFDTYGMATVIHWLHYGNIQSIAEDYKADEIFHTKHMIKVHLLCSKLQLRSLMNLAVELLGHGYLKNKSAPTMEEIDMTYSETDQMSGLRIYMAAWARCREHAPLQKFMMADPWDQIRFKALCKKHPDIQKDMKILDESSDPDSPISLNPRFHEICWYHDHPEGEQCGVSGKPFETAWIRMEPRLHEPI